MHRILWLTENYPPQRGGMAQSCDRVVYGLRQAGCDIEVLHFVNKAMGMPRRQLQQNGGYTPIAYEGSEPHTINIAWNYIKTLGQFDYLVCFGGYLSMIAAPVLAKWLGAKLATLLRGNDFDASLFVPRKRKILEDVLVHSHIVFAVSSEKAWKARSWFGLGNVHYVPNGIAASEWLPTTSEMAFANDWRGTNSGDKLCIGVFGQLKAKKGIQFLLDSLAKTNLSDCLYLLLVGDTEDALLEQLADQGIQYTLISFQDRYELMKYYLCCDALAIPSFYDGMPNVMLEAGALGVPVVAAAVDGMADLIDHQHDGLLFAPGNEDECRRAFYDLCALSNEERSQMGGRLKDKILNQYTAENETKSYLELLD